MLEGRAEPAMRGKVINGMREASTPLGSELEEEELQTEERDAK